MSLEWREEWEKKQDLLSERERMGHQTVEGVGVMSVLGFRSE